MGKNCYMSSISDLPICTRSSAEEVYNTSTSFNLVEAIKMHDTDLVYSLLGSGYQEDEIIEEGGALHWAVCKNMTVVVHNLLSIQRLDPNPLTKWQSTPLHAAADHNRYDITRILIRYGADMNAKTNTGNTPCHLAAYRGHSKTLLVLLQHGASIDVQNSSGNTPLDEARLNGRGSAMKLIISYTKRRGLDVSKLSQYKCNISRTSDSVYNYKGSQSGPLLTPKKPVESDLGPTYNALSMSSENVWSEPLRRLQQNNKEYYSSESLHRTNDNFYFNCSDDEVCSAFSSSSSLASEHVGDKRDEYFNNRKSKMPEERCECSSGSLCNCS